MATRDCSTLLVNIIQTLHMVAPNDLPRMHSYVGANCDIRRADFTTVEGFLGLLEPFWWSGSVDPHQSSLPLQLHGSSFGMNSWRGAKTNPRSRKRWCWWNTSRGRISVKSDLIFPCQVQADLRWNPTVPLGALELLSGDTGRRGRLSPLYLPLRSNASVDDFANTWLQPIW